GSAPDTDLYPARYNPKTGSKESRYQVLFQVICPYIITGPQIVYWLSLNDIEKTGWMRPEHNQGCFSSDIMPERNGELNKIRGTWIFGSRIKNF
ncbi:MAG: hypothetical protein JXA44_00670, partial [Methanospirillaceae archaeon]|nr:hypothetical protein [Methanospirillaceae archaeon]